MSTPPNTFPACVEKSFILSAMSKRFHSTAAIAQLGERQTEDLKVTGSIPVRGISFCVLLFFV
jgi:hypothetical protein